MSYPVPYCSLFHSFIVSYFILKYLSPLVSATSLPAFVCFPPVWLSAPPQLASPVSHYPPLLSVLCVLPSLGASSSLYLVSSIPAFPGDFGSWPYIARPCLFIRCWFLPASCTFVCALNHCTASVLPPCICIWIHTFMSSRRHYCNSLFTCHISGSSKNGPECCCQAVDQVQWDDSHHTHLFHLASHQVQDLF